jgi:subtilisin
MEESKMNKTRTIRWFGIGGITGLLIVLVVLVSFTTVSAQPLPDEPSGSQGSDVPADTSRLLQKAQKEGSVPVIVGLRTDFTPEGQLSRAQADDQRGAIESAGAGLRADLTGTGYQTLREYETVPYMALELTPEALRAVQDSPSATTIHEDVAVPPTLAESGPIVQAPIMWENNFRGGGKTIAVLDTGVDRFHPFLGGRVVEEACYSYGSDCPNGQRTQTGYDSGAPCTYAAEGCQHGTHVAGIAAGQDINGTGMAPNANIMSVQIFSRTTGADCVEEDPCVKSSTNDMIAALERVYQLRNTRDFAAVNMSLGAGRFTSNCDTAQAPLKAVIDNLKAAGIATVISSGNDGFTDAVSFPACISSAITVGSTTKQRSDAIAPNSNFSSQVDLLAPGVSILSSIPGGNFDRKSGTSMAAPHVAGAFALLEERYPSKTVNDISYALRDKGKLVKDTRAGGYLYAGHRINIAESANVRPLADDFASPKSLSGASFNVPGINEAATREIGEPDHLPADGASYGENSVWYSWTPPFSGTVTMDTCESNFDTALAVYTGSGAIDSLSQVASDNDSCAIYNDAGSKVSFEAVAGRNYRIAVAGFAHSADEGTFTLSTFHDPPSNDYFSGAQEISGNSATVEGTTLSATREFGEPDHYPDDPFFWLGENSVWYSWTAPSSGPVQMDTCTANISSTIALYTGSELSNLSRVASNRSTCPNALIGSKVTFEATAGTTYKIAVAEPGGDHTQDTFTLKLTGPTPPIDTASPSVTGTSPANNATGVLRGANVTATFPEAMQSSTINPTTFRLRKAGTTTNVAAAVSYDPATKRATLNPNVDLKAGTTYVATVTTGAKDLAGNQLDQDPNTAGNQPKSWKFKVKP